MAGKLSPSIMCADLMNLQHEVKKLESLNIEYLHIDFMDGKFVPNITFGTDLIRKLKDESKSMIRDIHIMAFEPQQYFDGMAIGNHDFVSVHYEACKNVDIVLDDLKQRGATPCIAISPDTNIEVIKEYIDKIEAVLVMTVYPGFAGQPLAPNSMERITGVKSLLRELGREDILIEVDGNVSWTNAPKMRKAGADIFVTGSSSVFCDTNVQKNVLKFRNIIV